MKNRLFTLFIALVATTALWAQNNVITYTATEKLPETTGEYSSGLHTNAFNVAITSHSFSNGMGTITFASDVTTIGYRAFYNCDGLTSAVIPNSVTSIGEDAFGYCKKMTSITIPHSVTSIGDYAFYDCSGMTSVTFGNSVKTIGNHAFESCDGLTSIEIPNSVTTIGEWAFRYCTGLISVTIPSSVTTIRDAAFRWVNNIVYNGRAYGSPWGAKCVNGHVEGYLVYSNDSKTTLRGCSSAATGEITIPNSVTKIDEYAFLSCKGLTSVIIGNSVTSIWRDAFAQCTGLTSITIPNSVTTIGNSAFQSCSGLTSITIPYSVTSIGDYAFWLCSGLASIVVDDGNKNYDSRDNCNAIIETATNTLIKGCKNSTIPNSVKTIGTQAFYSCYGLKSITIPNSVTSIGYNAFDYCSDLMSIVVGDGNKTFDSRNNCNAIIETASNKLILGCGTTIIPNSVKTIDDDAFSGCKTLTSITIPNSVTSIGDDAFYGCDSLTSVTIGSSVRTIGTWAFMGCDGLASITCEAVTPPTCGSSCFEYVDISIPLYVPKNSISAYQNAKEWKDFTNIKAIEDRTDFDINNTKTTISELEAWVMVPLDAKGEVTKYSYWLYLDNARTDLVCSMDFNATGKMSNPVIRKAPMREQAEEEQTFDSFTFEVSGLKANTTYYYVLKAFTNTQTFVKEGSFTTQSSVTRNVSSQVKKVCKHNKIYIESGDKTFDIWGNLISQ